MKARVYHGMSNTPEYRAYRDMLTRCYNPKCKAYRFYGARGINVCDKWLLGFTEFYKDMGKKPSSIHSLDKIDNDKNYSPENCRWALREVQDVNTRKAYELNGQKISFRKIAKKLNIPRGRIEDRIRRGIPIDQAIKAPKKIGNNQHTKKKLRDELAEENP